MESYIEYLESRLPNKEVENKYQKNFEKHSRYLGNCVYTWKGIVSTDTRELFLLGVLRSEKIEFKER